VRWWRSAVGMGWVLAALDLLLDVYGAVLTRQHGAVFTSPEINAVRFGSGVWPSTFPGNPHPQSIPSRDVSSHRTARNPSCYCAKRCMGA
jgi:hypothetical protein